MLAIQISLFYVWAMKRCKHKWNRIKNWPEFSKTWCGRLGLCPPKINPWNRILHHNLCWNALIHTYFFQSFNVIDLNLQASSFIEQVVEDESQMEGLLQDCSRIMVWELNVESSNSFYPPKWSVMNNLDVIAPLAWNFGCERS